MRATIAAHSRSSRAASATLRPWLIALCRDVLAGPWCVDRHQSQTAPARRPCEPPRLPQYPREVLPVPQPETVDRAEVRDRSVSCEVAKREVAPQPPRDLPPAVDSCVAAYNAFPSLDGLHEARCHRVGEAEAPCGEAQALSARLDEPR